MRSSSSHIVNCLTSSRKHTSMMHVYRHCVLLRFNSMLMGMSMTPPMAPTQPKHSFRQEETLFTWQPESKRIHSLIFMLITDNDSTH